MAELASIDHPALGAQTARARRRWRLPFSPWHLILMPASLVMVLPLVWMVDTSFMTDAEINRFPPTIVPSGINLGGYSQVLSESHYPRWFVNSVIVSGTTVIAQLVLCSLAGYAFARIRFAGRTLMFLLMIWRIFAIAPAVVYFLAFVIFEAMMFGYGRANAIDTYNARKRIELAAKDAAVDGYLAFAGSSALLLFDDQDRMFVVKLDGAGKISFGKLEKPSARCIDIGAFQTIRELFGRSACT